MLIFNAIEKKLINIKDPQDKRRRINKMIVSYLDRDDVEYRKGFYFPASYTYDDMRKEIPGHLLSC